jgi:hypothetical protein
MQTIYISDPEWQETFPHRVAPFPDEWLPGLLLRCDEVNDWDSGTTLKHLRRSTKWQSEMHDPTLIVPSSLKFDHLARWLAVPRVDLLATTYLLELARCYGTFNLFNRHLTAQFEFCLCPVCLAQDRLLRRIFTLPSIMCCPQHHVKLLNVCQCGSQLRLFSKQTQPFTCHCCCLDWAKLPRCRAEPENISFEQTILTYYEFFFSRGTHELFERAFWLVNNKMKEERLKRDGEFHDKRKTRFLGKIPPFPTKKTSYYPSHETSLIPYLHDGTMPLGALVGLLVDYNLPLDQILVDPGPLPYSGGKGD